jgi:hypothetical protein
MVPFNLTYIFVCNIGHEAGAYDANQENLLLTD